MTKVVQKEEICLKCGQASEQMVVYSINFSLGSASSNERLMRHQQKCPHCGYAASSISNLPSGKEVFEMFIKLDDETIRYYKVDKTNDNKYNFYYNDFELSETAKMSECYSYTYEEKDGLMFVKVLSDKLQGWPIITNEALAIHNDWGITLDEVIYSGEERPDNFQEVIEYLDEMFCVKKGRKEISFMVTKGDRKDILTLFLINESSTASIVHSTGGTPSFMKDSIVPVSLYDFNYFYDHIVFKTDDWETSKFSNELDVMFSLQIIDNKRRKSINWKGELPYNWNSFLDLLIDFENKIYNNK